MQKVINLSLFTDDPGSEPPDPKNYFPITIKFDDGETKVCQSPHDVPVARAFRVIQNAADLPLK